MPYFYSPSIKHLIIPLFLTLLPVQLHRHQLHHLFVVQRCLLLQHSGLLRRFSPGWCLVEINWLLYGEWQWGADITQTWTGHSLKHQLLVFVYMQFIVVRFVTLVLFVSQ